jgi:putative transposase
MMIDTTVVRSHQHAAGQKKLCRCRSPWPVAWRLLYEGIFRRRCSWQSASLLLRPGQKAAISEAEALIEGYRFGALIADKGFDSNDLIEQVESLEAVVVILPRKNRLVQRDIDRNLYADRNTIELSFGRIKQYRRIATRYEKTARNYRSFLHLASIMTWLL